MAISLVGSPVENSAINGADVTLILPVGMVQNDVCYVFVAADHVTDVGTSSSGWTALRSPDLAVGTGTISQVFRKVIGLVPDVSIVLTNNGDADDAMAAVGYALRGVDTTTPEDATPTTATSTSSAAPNSPAITTVTDGAWVISFGCTDGVAETSVTAPSGYSNQVDIAASDINQITVAGATKTITSAGVENPAVWTTWTVNAGTDAAGWSVAVRPTALTHYDLDVSAGSFAVTGTAATLTRVRQLAANTGSFSVTGANVELLPAKHLDVDAGSFALTGSALNWWMMAPAGSFTVTGSTADLQSSQAPVLEADAGSFAVTGTAATLGYGFTIVPVAGSYLITGADAVLFRAMSLTADAGSFTFTGENVDFEIVAVPPPIALVSHPVAWGPIGGLADLSSQPLMTEQIGAVLACTNGVWTSLTGLQLTYSYQWRRDAVDICDAILNAYTLEQADSGAAIDCEVTVTDGTFTTSEDSNNIICETEEFPVRTHYRKVTGMHSGGTLTFTRTIEDAPCPPDPGPDPDPDPNPDPDPDPDPGEEGNFIIDANDDFIVDIDEFFLTDATS